MSNELQIFNNPKFGQVRTVEINGKIHFVGIDIAKSLGYKDPNSAISRHCKGSVKHPVLTSGGTQEMNVISEGDIYRLAASSELPGADEFESWIFDKVIPSIRKHGMYAKDELLDNPDLMIEVLQELKREREEKRLLQTENEEMKPKALFADSVTASSTSILVADLAKILKKNGIEIGEIRLWKWLRNNEYVIKEKGRSYNMPTQKSMDLKTMEVKEGTNIDSRGESHITKTTLITGKGQIYFVNKFLGKEDKPCQLQ